jgi:long-chain acyl-CoA synthetase
MAFFVQVSDEHSNRECLGTREILSEEDEVQPNGKVFKKYVLGGFNWRSFTDFGDEAEAVSRSLRRLGLKSKDRVAILAETRAEWVRSTQPLLLDV